MSNVSPHIMQLHRAVAVLLVLWASALQAQTLSLTFDDGLNPEESPAALNWNGQILSSLQDAGVLAMVFPSLKNVGGRKGMELIAAWSAAGHGVGNHTSQHRSLSSSRASLSEFIQDVQDADNAFKELPTWQRRLRFPFLKEGNTREKRDGIRRWMNENGYSSAPSLSEVLCARHSMTTRSIYAEQDEVEERGHSG